MELFSIRIQRTFQLVSTPQGRTQLHLHFPSHQQDQSSLKCLQEEEGDNRLTP